ncbi:MAG TPA: penicillin-binding transpeptidase domain-containing protein [Steroidobacteraceae bacterium]
MRRRDGEVEFDAPQFRLRARVLTGALLASALVLLGRSVQLQVFDQRFLAEQADMRHARDAKMLAHRGAVLDRFGEPLAVSSPVDTVWVNPPEFAQAGEGIAKLARSLDLNRQWLEQRVTSNLDREFLYVARHVDPEEAAKIKKLGIPGVYLLREYRRYYPNGEITGHVLGFTNLDEDGQEGLELAYNRSLAGIDGEKRVIQDGHGRIVQNVEINRTPVPGEDLHTSLDLRIQYLAYRELKGAIRTHRARAGTVIVIDIPTGEVLAMVNQPSFNPNDRTQYEVARYRNRAATDIFEPGSSIKPFVVAAALASGRYRTDSTVDATPFTVSRKLIRDKHDLGTIDVGQVLSRSSNVAMAKIALSLEPEQMHGTLRALGFGEVTASGFPGESAGLLTGAANWRPIGIATMAYGYGLSVTPLQLAQAYATVGAFGLHRPITFRRVEDAIPGERVMPQKVARDLIGLLEGAVKPAGTGIKAAVPGYRVAGKTGTAWKATAGGYSTDRYLSVFAGVVPATRPRLAVVVMVDEPRGVLYYGGDVAAPVFSAVTSGALRLMSVAPDDLARVSPVTFAEAVQ